MNKFRGYVTPKKNSLKIDYLLFWITFKHRQYMKSKPILSISQWPIRTCLVWVILHYFISKLPFLKLSFFLWFTHWWNHLCETDWLWVGKDIKGILKFHKNELRLWFQCYILIPRICLRKTLFEHTVPPPIQKAIYTPTIAKSCQIRFEIIFRL